MKKFLSFVIVLSAVFCFAEDKIYYPEFEDAVSFYASFDTATADADISEGREKPMAVLGKLNFAEGIRGKALCCGADGANIRYLRKDNFSFNRPGTLLFFFKGIDWKNSEGSRILFSGIESGKKGCGKTADQQNPDFFHSFKQGFYADGIRTGSRCTGQKSGVIQFSQPCGKFRILNFFRYLFRGTSGSKSH